MTVYRTLLAASCGIGMLAGSAEAVDHLQRRNGVRRRDERMDTTTHTTSSGNFAVHLTPLDNEEPPSALARVDPLLDRRHHGETSPNRDRALQQRGPPAKPEFSARPAGNAVAAAATFHQGGRRSIALLLDDCRTPSPLSFSVEGFADGQSVHSYAYDAPSTPSTGIVDFIISLVGVFELKMDRPNADVVVCVELATAHTLARTLLTIDVDLYQGFSFGIGGGGATEDKAGGADADATAEKESGQRLVGGRFRQENGADGQTTTGDGFRSKLLQRWRSAVGGLRRRKGGGDGPN